MAVFQALRNLFVSPAFDEPGEIVPAAPTTYAIKPLTMRHIRDVVALNARCFRNGENYTRHTFNYLLTDAKTLGYRVITEDGDMAGFAFVMMQTDGAGHLTTIGVAPEHRRRGLAKMLLAHVERALRAKGLSTVVLEVRVSNTAAQRLYTENGYSCVQRVTRYYNDGEDGYLMMRSLV